MARTDDSRPRRRKELVDVSWRELKREPWASPHRGYHRSGTIGDAARQRILDAAAVLPEGGVIGGWAAAYLHGATHLDGRGQPVLLVLPPNRLVDRPGIDVIRVELVPEEITSRRGIACTSGVRTAFDLLRLASDLTEAVAAGDCLLRAGVCREDEILAYAARRPGRRGSRQLRAATKLLEPAAASPPESRLRMLCRDAGLPPLPVNTPVHDLRGNFLGIPDLFEPRAGLVIEYDGEYHREIEQHTADNAREERLEAHGLSVVRVTSLDLKDPATTAERPLDAHARQVSRALATAWITDLRPAA